MDNVTETFISVLFYKIKCGPSMRAQDPKGGFYSERADAFVISPNRRT